MDRLRIDTDLLIETGRELRFVANEFSHANANSEHVAEAVGHPGLAEAIRAFADEWDDTRQGMVKNIATLGRSAAVAGEAFEAVDQKFGAALRGEM